jgi:hypothetical protein
MKVAPPLDYPNVAPRLSRRLGAVRLRRLRKIGLSIIAAGDLDDRARSPERADAVRGHG